MYFVCDVAWGGGDFLSAPAYEYEDGSVYITDTFNKGDKEVTRPIVVGKLNTIFPIKISRPTAVMSIVTLGC